MRLLLLIGVIAWHVGSSHPNLIEYLHRKFYNVKNPTTTTPHPPTSNGNGSKPVHPGEPGRSNDSPGISINARGQLSLNSDPTSTKESANNLPPGFDPNRWRKAENYNNQYPGSGNARSQASDLTAIVKDLESPPAASPYSVYQQPAAVSLLLDPGAPAPLHSRSSFMNDASDSAASSDRHLQAGNDRRHYAGVPTIVDDYSNLSPPSTYVIYPSSSGGSAGQQPTPAIKNRFSVPSIEAGNNNEPNMPGKYVGDQLSNARQDENPSPLEGFARESSRISEDESRLRPQGATPPPKHSEPSSLDLATDNTGPIIIEEQGSENNNTFGAHTSQEQAHSQISNEDTLDEFRALCKGTTGNLAYATNQVPRTISQSQ